MEQVKEQSINYVMQWLLDYCKPSDSATFFLGTESGEITEKNIYDIEALIKYYGESDEGLPFNVLHDIYGLMREHVGGGFSPRSNNYVERLKQKLKGKK